jgi:predicted RNA-binding protein with TRAM domain
MAATNENHDHPPLKIGQTYYLAIKAILHGQGEKR